MAVVRAVVRRRKCPLKTTLRRLSVRVHNVCSLGHFPLHTDMPPGDCCCTLRRQCRCCERQPPMGTLCAPVHVKFYINMYRAVIIIIRPWHFCQKWPRRGGRVVSPPDVSMSFLSARFCHLDRNVSAPGGSASAYLPVYMDPPPATSALETPGL